MMDEMSLGGFSKTINESTSTVELDFSHLEVNDRVKFVIILSPVIKPRYSGILSSLPVTFKTKITNASQKQSYHHLRQKIYTLMLRNMTRGNDRGVMPFAIQILSPRLKACKGGAGL